MKNSIIYQVIKATCLLFLLCFSLCISSLHAQESCYEQYIREHNMTYLTAEDADDSYDEQKKVVLAKQMYGDRYMLWVDTISGKTQIGRVDGTYIADVHFALVDSTWYMWLSVDPLADKYPGNTPYMYCLGNPIRLVDPNGKWVAVTSNDDTGTSYTVIGGAVDMDDCNVYLVDNGYDVSKNGKPQDATILTQTATPYTFCNEQGNIVGKPCIDMNDNSGNLFMTRFQNNEIPLSLYILPTAGIEGNLSGWPGGNCDFKTQGDANRGMPLSILGGKIATARDVGNLAAGYLAGRKGISYGATMWAFDALQNITTPNCTTGEPSVSRWPQLIGYSLGQHARRASKFAQVNIYRAYY